MDIGPSVVEVVESAMFVVGETVDLFVSCCPRLKYACGVASAHGVECKSGGLYGGLLGYTNCDDGHAGVVVGQSGVGDDGNVVEDSEERLLVQDQIIDVGSKDLQLLNEVFPLLRAERYGTGREEDVGVVCREERAVRSDGQLCVGQNLQTVLGVLVCAVRGSVVLRHPRAGNVGDTRRAGGVRTLDGLCNSVRAGEEAEADVATSTYSLDVWVVNGGKRRWMVVLWWVRLRCGVLCRVVLCCVLCCVVLCCVVLCCVVWCCVVLCSVVLCCVVFWDVGWRGWCCVVLMCCGGVCSGTKER